MVKIIWKHGEKSIEPPHLRVSKEDVMRMPQILRDYAADAEGKGKKSWTVPVDENVKLVIVAGKQSRADYL